MCVEEMMSADVPAGALFYGESRRRLDVEFDADLRRKTEAAAARFHELMATGLTPPARRDARCTRCSLEQVCLPDAMNRSAGDFLQEIFRP